MPMLNPDTLDEEIPRVAEILPPFPQVIARLIDELNNQASSLDTLVRLARNDPVVSANMLATANRVRRGNVQPDIYDPFVAASLIGLDQIRRIVATVGMNRFLSESKGSDFLLWHSRAVAIVAQELAMLTEVSPEKAYMAAILHDVGQLCFHILAPELFLEAYQRSAMDGRLLEHEAAAFGVNHAQVGGALARYWLLPEDFVSAIATHHDDEIVTGRLQAVVNLAESLARGLDIPPSPKNRLTHINQPAIELLGIDWRSPAMMDLFGRCRARFRQAEVR